MKKIDLFTAIHKAIRSLLYDSAIRIQNFNFKIETEKIILLNQLEKTLHFLHQHADHEDRFIFPPIEAREPGCTDVVESQHRKGDQFLSDLEKIILQIRHETNLDELEKLCTELNRTYTDFMAFYLRHMNDEERYVLPVSQMYLNDDQLREIRVQVQLDTTPEQYAEWLRWMLPALNQHELEQLFTQIRSGAPESVVRLFDEIGSQSLRPEIYAFLDRQVIS